MVRRLTQRTLVQCVLGEHEFRYRVPDEDPLRFYRGLCKKIFVSNSVTVVKNKNKTKRRCDRINESTLLFIRIVDSMSGRKVLEDQTPLPLLFVKYQKFHGRVDTQVNEEPCDVPNVLVLTTTRSLLVSPSFTPSLNRVQGPGY